MRVQTQRCRNCQGTYDYQSSGQHLARYGHNDRYCNPCWEVAAEALKTCPKRVEAYWEDVTDEKTVDAVLAEHERRSYLLSYLTEFNLAQESATSVINAVLKAARTQYENSGISMWQHKPGLFKFDVDNPKKIVDSMRIHVVHLDGVEYDLSIWLEAAEPPKVQRKMERDLDTKHTRPWKDYQ